MSFEEEGPVLNMRRTKTIRILDPRRPGLVLLGLAVILSAGACGSDDKRPPPPVAEAQPVVAAPVVEAPKSEASADAPYVYSPVGKRDPFKSFYKVIRGPEKHGPGTILTKYEIDQLKLTAIISGISRPRAQVELPDGKGIVIKVGTRIGKNFGRVVRIKNDEVVVAEDYRDYIGRKVTNFIHMKIVKEKIE
jgi:type IV pilus assembly protein PilP